MSPFSSCFCSLSAYNTLGGSRILCKCTDGKERNCLIRGKMKKRVWIKIDDIVLLERDDYNENNGMVVWKYDQSEVKTLKKMGELESLEPKV